MTVVLDTPTTARAAAISFLWLEITRDCQLTCPGHCYAQAGPGKGHGAMTSADWRRVISEATALGVEQVQLIGGEPTRHPAFAELLRHALAEDLAVEVYTNLYRVSAEAWELFADPRVSLATSYYSDDPTEHDAITGRAGSHAKTRANLAEAVRRGIPVRAGIIDHGNGQRTGQARDQLAALGVTRVSVDRVRGVGNAARVLPSTSELCGHCGHGRAAVGPDGEVWPCVFGRFLAPAGNVRTAPLGQVLASPAWADLVATLSTPRRAGGGCTPDEDSCMPSWGATGCVPDSCTPREDSCQPSPGMDDSCVPTDSPCQPAKPACLPKFPLTGE